MMFQKLLPIFQVKVRLACTASKQQSFKCSLKDSFSIIIIISFKKVAKN